MEQPEIVGSLLMAVAAQRWWTAASREPSGLYWKRTSRIGPYCASNEGTTFRLPKRLGTRRNIGFSGSCGVPWPGLGTRKPPEPPKVGWAWQSRHWSPLCREPRPLELVWNWGKTGSSSPSPVTWEPSGTSAQVSQVDSNWPARRTPSLNNASSLAVMVAPVVGFGLMTGGCGIGMPLY